MTDLKQRITAEALRLGFSRCGFARNEPPEQIRPFYTAFIKRNGHAGMDYLESNMEKRLNPELVMPGTKTVIALLMNYFPNEIIPGKDNFTVAKYAYGQDYHKIIRKRLKDLTRFIGLISEGSLSKSFVDSGSVLEKFWAQKCGTGWQGKNTLIIQENAGSFFFIGIIFTSLDLEPDPPGSDHCGTCENCITACPTGALNSHYQLDIPRCISFQTIENNADIQGDLHSALNDRIYGCDICQDVCPYNRFSHAHAIPEFLPGELLKSMRREDWLAMNESDFDLIFRDSAVKRTGYQKLMRNIRAAMGGSML